MLGELLLQQEAFTGIPTMPCHSHSWSSLLIVVLFFTHMVEHKAQAA